MQWAYRQSCLRWQRPHQLHSSCLLYHSRRKYSLPLELLLSLQFSFLRSSIVDLLTIQLFCNQNCSPFWSSFVVKLRTNFPSRNCKFNFLAFPTAEMKACWPRCTSQVSGQAFLTLTFLPIQGSLITHIAASTCCCPVRPANLRPSDMSRLCVEILLAAPGFLGLLPSLSFYHHKVFSPQQNLSPCIVK